MGERDNITAILNCITHCLVCVHTLGVLSHGPLYALLEASPHLYKSPQTYYSLSHNCYNFNDTDLLECFYF